MRFDLARMIGPLIAALLLVLLIQQTAGSLHDSGVWTHPPRTAPAASPYVGLERLAGGLARAPAGSPQRDPFAFGPSPATALVRRPAVARPATPTEPPRPQLTAIVWVENNPSATIRWNGKDRTVQVNTLFDEFRVRSITREQVILEHGAETLVLQLPRKGD
jgi:hypothetical protein